MEIYPLLFLSKVVIVLIFVRCSIRYAHRMMIPEPRCRSVGKAQVGSLCPVFCHYTSVVWSEDTMGHCADT